tara:strand:+ start:295 stop:930 length:636 start_codon:yes stop_codon:yes gene_type:complete
MVELTILTLNLFTKLHSHKLGQFRLTSLIRQIAEIIPSKASVLDVGCGNGKLAAGIGSLRSDLRFEGIDLVSVPGAAIPIHYYDGHTIPFPDNSWDVCMANDVLHHCDNPIAILAEMCRVSKSAILLKDHIADNWADRELLKLMDWFGNVGYGTPLPYNYFSSDEWRASFSDLGMAPSQYLTELHLYPPQFLGVLDRKMHFLTLLEFSKDT